VDKNKQMRDIAEDEDATLLIEYLTQLGEEFRADMKAAFPNADVDEHLKGKIFDAQDVMGILCDGQMMLGEVIQRVFGLADGTVKPIERTAGREIGTSGTSAAHGTKGEGTAAYGIDGNIISTQIKSINMREQFPALFALLGVEEMQMTEEGSFVNMELLETLNAAIDGSQKELAEAKASVETLTTEKAELEQKLTDAEAAHQQALDELNAKMTEQETALATKDETIATLTQEKEDAATQLSSLNETLAERDKTIEEQASTIESQNATIADQNATITELNESAGAKGQGGGAPQNNGQGVQAPSTYSMEGAYDPSLSPAENRKRIQAYEAEQRKRLAKG